MGWVWREDDESGDRKDSSAGGEFDEDKKQSAVWSDQGFTTRKVLRSSCKTEEVEPGKFIQKCEKTEEVLRECLGKPAEVVESKKEYTEEDVSDLMTRGSHSFPVDKHENEEGPFTFPGLRNDIGELERHFHGHFGRFFQAAEEMKKSIFDVFEGFPGENSFPPSTRRNIPIDGRSEDRTHQKQEKTKDGSVDLSGLAKEV